ncbi:MAG: RimK/LysX family protein [Synechococcales bacterium]|nr:RimK/LysX family protein [Synechococcales bacterium]
MVEPSKRSLLPLIGWREIVALPELGISEIRAKVDTGARTSSLYAFDIEIEKAGDRPQVRFKVHPHQDNTEHTVTTEAPLLEERHVRSSNGQEELRPVIQTLIRLNGQEWPIELTLTHRKSMEFRMLLGRQAIRGHFWVDSGRSFLQSTDAAHHTRKTRKQQRKQG